MHDLELGKTINQNSFIIHKKQHSYLACKQFNRYTKLCNEKEREGTSQLNREIERVTRQKYRNKKKTKMKD